MSVLESRLCAATFSNRPVTGHQFPGSLVELRRRSERDRSSEPAPFSGPTATAKPRVRYMLTPAFCTAAPHVLASCVDFPAPPSDPAGRVIELSRDRDARGRRDRAGTSRSTRMPDMVALSDSHWIVVYNEYPTPLATGNWARIVKCTTRDAGETWKTVILDQQRDRTRGSLGNWNMVRISRLADGRLALTSTTRTKGHRCYVWFSDDEGETWDGPVDACLNDAAGEAVGSSIRYTEASRIVDFPDGTLAVLAHRAHLNQVASAGHACAATALQVPTHCVETD